mmetsp:Transcript_48353/g.147106  ORF Transcript_48353/g.147106 Transcript_48353/m.147106 type:complete len:217 (-) Transcript_48353:76-726(-)
MSTLRTSPRSALACGSPPQGLWQTSSPCSGRCWGSRPGLASCPTPTRPNTRPAAARRRARTRRGARPPASSRAGRPPGPSARCTATRTSRRSTAPSRANSVRPRRKTVAAAGFTTSTPGCTPWWRGRRPTRRTCTSPAGSGWKARQPPSPTQKALPSRVRAWGGTAWSSRWWRTARGPSRQLGTGPRFWQWTLMTTPPSSRRLATATCKASLAGST